LAQLEGWVRQAARLEGLGVGLQLSKPSRARTVRAAEAKLQSP